MGSGWTLAIAALGCAFSAWQHVSAWSADLRGGPKEAPRPVTAVAAPWLLLGSLALTAVALLSAL
jgi:hypothetical protein